MKKFIVFMNGHRLLEIHAPTKLSAWQALYKIWPKAKNVEIKKKNDNAQN